MHVVYIKFLLYALCSYVVVCVRLGNNIFSKIDWIADDAGAAFRYQIGKKDFLGQKEHFKNLCSAKYNFC